MSDDLTVRVLTEIRDEIRLTRGDLSGRIDQLREELTQRIDETNERVGRLENRVTETNVYLSTELTAVNGTMKDVVTLLKDRRDLRGRVAQCERDIAVLKRRAR